MRKASPTAGGLMLIATTGVALGLATWLGGDVLQRFPLALSLQRWINDGLMAIFFLLVGLELKREVLVGELSSARNAALPVFAALGGMVVPALIYSAFNAQTPTAAGWGIPMATDIAFAVGILVLLARRIPRNLIVFLTALAIADDLGAVLVIALFYTETLNLRALGMAGALFALLLLLNRGGIRAPLAYAAVGLVLWYAMHQSGIHATMAGILLALAIPARSTVAGPSPLQRIEQGIAPWVTFLIVPLFALANAGIDLRSVAWSDAFASRVTVGVFSGLVMGKFVGIALFSWAAVRLGWARLPAGVEWPHLLGAAWLGGIGFTMSLFIGQLAFHDAAMVEQAKIGILAGSAVSALLGLAWLFANTHRTGREGRVSPNPR